MDQIHDDFVEAYLAWSDAEPSNCKCKAHHTVELRESFVPGERLPDIVGYIKDVPDANVCKREREWRRYCKIRNKYRELDSYKTARLLAAGEEHAEKLV